jgi:type I restriction enzyme M protein
MNSATIVQKLWNYCNVLRDDGMSYGDYVEQLTYLLFLKMADERSKPPFNLAGESPSPILKGYDWPSLLAKDGDELFDHYRHTLEKLGAEKGTIGLIFAKALNKFQDPAKLRRLVVDLIDGENWSAMGADVKGDAYEGLLEKNAQDTKSGAGSTSRRAHSSRPWWTAWRPRRAKRCATRLAAPAAFCLPRTTMWLTTTPT